MDDNRTITCLTALAAALFLSATEPAGAESNQLRDGGFESENLRGWLRPEQVEIERVSVEGQTGEAALRVSWHDVAAFTVWARAGGLLRASSDVLAHPLVRDTRYHLSCRMKVERFDVAPEAEKWLAATPQGQFDRPTVTVGCHGGTWNSGMPWLAYDMSKSGTWQQLGCDFVTSCNSGGGLNLMLDAYPHYRPPMQSSGVLYLDDVTVEPCRPRVGFTRRLDDVNIDGDLSDWWQTNPAVITRDQVTRGDESTNRDASGLFYTMWDDSHFYFAAKIIDDDVTDRDAVAIHLDDHQLVVSADAAPAGVEAVVRRAEALGSTANMVRIVSQYGESVAGRDGYVVEMAVPRSALSPSDADPAWPPRTVALEIRDWDREEKSPRCLRYPHTGRSDKPRETATVALAGEKGELRGGEYPVYAVTDAGNRRQRPRMLAVKNVSARLVAQGRLGYPAAVYRRGPDDKVDALVSWTTNLPASGYVEYGLNETLGSRAEATDAVGEPTGNAMRVVLRDLEPNRRYRFRVVTRAADGDQQATADDDHVIDTTRARVAGVQYGQVPLAVIETDGARSVRGRWPVTGGVPFPAGHLPTVKHLRLVDAERRPVDAQFQPLAEWPDGSVKWALVDFQADPSSVGGDREHHRLEYGTSVSGPAPRTGLRVEEDTDHVRIDTGAIQLAINKHDFNLLDEVRVGPRVVAGGGRLVMVDDEGRQYVAREPSTVEVEENGPMRVCVRVVGQYRDDDGSPWFDYEVRIHAYAGSPLVRLTHNYTCRLKQRIDPAEGRTRPLNPTPVHVRSMWLELPLRNNGVTSVRCGTTPGTSESIEVPLPPAGVELRQDFESSARVAGRAFRRLPGWVSVDNVIAAVGHFWQLYPKAMSIRPDRDGCVLRVDTLPPVEASDYPSKPGSIEDYVWGYLRDGRYRLRRGEGRSHDVFFCFRAQPGAQAAMGAALTAGPLLAAAPPKWYCDSGAIGFVQPRDKRFEAYDRAFDRGLQGLLETREAEPFFEQKFGRYGLRNFGDNFGSDGPNWDNVEYDLGHCCLVQFMRAGNERALRLAREILLHNMDVDCVKIRDGYESLCHHTGDHNARLAGIGHTWCEGLWEYYYLTGDRHAARKALGIANTLAHQTPGLCAAGAPGSAGSRNYGWSVVGLMASYHATADPLYLNAAREIEEVVVRTQHPFRGGWLHRLSPGHCFHAPAHEGRVYFMHEIVLAGQIRFHQATGDPDVGLCLANTAAGLLDEFARQQADGLPGYGYTSCPFMLRPGPTQTSASRNPKHGFGSLKRYEALYYVAFTMPSDSMARNLDAILGQSGDLFTGSFSPQGKFFAQGTRWVPNTLYYFSRLPQKRPK